MEDLASAADMSLSGLYAAFSKGTLRVDSLEKIATVLGVKTSELIDGENISLGRPPIEALTIKHVEELRAFLLNLKRSVESGAQSIKEIEKDFLAEQKKRYDSAYAYWSVNVQLYDSKAAWIKDEPIKEDYVVRFETELGYQLEGLERLSRLIQSKII